jgi:hypothetical protein
LPLADLDRLVLTHFVRLNLPAVAILDHRYLGVVRPRHVPALALLP